MFQAENDPKRSQGTARAIPHSFTDCEDITPTQIIPALHEKKVNVDNDVTDCEFAEINTNKPLQSELFQDEMAKQVIIIGDYIKDKQLFEDMPADNVASKDLPIQIKEVEKVVPNSIIHVKNTFDEVVSLFTIALQSSITVKSEDIPNIIPTDKADKTKPIDVDDNYFDATQDIYKDQREKSNAKVAASNADDVVVLWSDDDNIKNEQDENENTYIGIDLPSQENVNVLSGNDATLTNVSDSSDEESTPKKSKRFTFTDSDLPASDEIRDILMSYPKPTVVESYSESEPESSSEDESCEFLRHYRNKTEPVTKIDLTRMIGIEKLPERVSTRLRKQPSKLLNGVSKNKSTVLKPSYLTLLTEQEDQMDEDTILENIKRLKSFKNAKTYKDSKNHESIKEEKKETTPRNKTDNKSKEHKGKVKVNIEKPERKGNISKTKSIVRKNTKEDSLKLNSISAAKTTIRRTRSMKTEQDGKNTQNKDSKNHESIKEEKKETTPQKKTDNKSKEHKRKVKVKIEKPEIESTKSKTKSFARKNTTEGSLATRRTRSIKTENDDKHIQKKSIFPENENKKPGPKRKPYKKERTIFPEIEGRRSKRQQRVKEKIADTMKAPTSILKKSIPKQITVYNVSSSSSESPKSLKRSLVDDSDVRSPKRMRLHNYNNNNSIYYASPRATPTRVMKTQYEGLSALPELYVRLVRYEPAQKRTRTLNSNRNFLTLSQIARTSIHRACKRIRGGS